VSAKCKEPLCGRPFPQVACDRQAQRYAFNQPLVCVHPVLRSTHAWLLLGSGTTSRSYSLYGRLPAVSDHPRLEGCSGCDARPSLCATG
jgi:hypothetical protein